MSARSGGVPPFVDPAEFERIHATQRRDWEPIGEMEELLVRLIASEQCGLWYIAQIQGALDYLAAQEAIIRPYLGGGSYSPLESAIALEQDIEYRRTELEFLEEVIHRWEGVPIDGEIWSKLEDLSVGTLFGGYEAAQPAQQLERLNVAADRLRFVLDALEGVEPPTEIRILASLAPPDLDRYRNQALRRLQKLTEQLGDLQDRRKRKNKGRRETPIIDIDPSDDLTV